MYVSDACYFTNQRIFVAVSLAIGLLIYNFMPNTDTIARHLILSYLNSTETATQWTKSDYPDGQGQLHLSSLIRVEAAGEFVERVRQFNIALGGIRRRVLTDRGDAEWRRDVLRGRLTVVWGGDDDWLRQLSAFANVTTVALPWNNQTRSPWNSLTDFSNLLTQTYYAWTGDGALCSALERPGVLRNKYIIYKQTCSRNVNATVSANSLEPVYLHRKPISRRMSSNGRWRYYLSPLADLPPEFVFHLNVLRDVVVTPTGIVVTRGLKLVPYACVPNLKAILPRGDLLQAPIYNELFVISQFWGEGVFHRMVEVLPRLALCLEFLRTHPSVRIAVPQTERLAELIRPLGLSEARLISGVVRAKVVYLPRSTPCGDANVQETQMLSHHYRDYIDRTFSPRTRDRLVLIRRSQKRRFVDQEGIEEAMERAAADYNLTYTLFADNPTPSLNETMMMFHSAVMVVAPVGAGESNLLFSRPGTYVVEAVCNPPHVNLCFQRLAHVLGHHWHGATSRGGCEAVVDVPALRIEAAVRNNLELWRNSTGRRTQFYHDQQPSS